jgi:hypothetical protein
MRGVIPCVFLADDVHVARVVWLACGSYSHAFWPPYQIAVQSPRRSATAKVCPVTALSPQSSARVLPTRFCSSAVPDSATSEIRLASELGAELEVD